MNKYYSDMDVILAGSLPDGAKVGDMKDMYYRWVTVTWLP